MVLLVGCATPQQGFYIQEETEFDILYDTIDIIDPPPQNPSLILEDSEDLEDVVLEEAYTSSLADNIQYEENYPIIEIIRCEIEELYLAFLQESSNWLRIACFQCCGELLPISYTFGPVRITDRLIFDFDGDGVRDLWFRAVLDEREFVSPRWSNSITGFATIKDDEVVLLLSGYTSGGSIGGDFITFGYDQKTSEYVIVVNRFTGGFGGNHNGGNIYSMQNGELTRLYSFDYIHFWANHLNGNEEDEHLFKVNDEEVCEEVYYTLIISRFFRIHIEAWVYAHSIQSSFWTEQLILGEV